MILVQYSGFLASGLVWTLLLSATVIICATAVATLFATALVSRKALPRRAAFAVVEVLRDVPLMVTVLFTYFVLPVIGVSLSPFWSTTLSLSLWGGANGAHVIRAGLLSVSKDQREAAAALGLRAWKAFRLVVMPQAMRVILPPYVALVTALVQATSLGAVVGVHELLRSGQILIEQTTISTGGSPAFVIYGAILVVYFAICWTISAVGRALERRINRPYERRQTGAAALAAAEPQAVLDVRA